MAVVWSIIPAVSFFGLVPETAIKAGSKNLGCPGVCWSCNPPLTFFRFEVEFSIAMKKENSDEA